MSRFLISINKGKDAVTEVSLDSVKAILQEVTHTEAGTETFSYGDIKVAYSGKVSIYLDEPLGRLFILSGYFRRPGTSSDYSDNANDLVSLWDRSRDPLNDEFEGSFSLIVCYLNSPEVLLMADRFGTRPVYYSSSERHLTVSSEAFCLLPWQEKLRISSAALSSSFWLGFCRAPESMVSGILKVPDNGAVKLGASGNIETFAKPCPLVVEPDDTLEFEAVVCRIEEALEQEFTSLARRADRVAVLLSGGVDSSIMAAYAKRHFSDCVAFSCEIEGFANPELKRAVYVAEKLGLRHEIVRLNSSDLGQVFDEVVSMLEGPSRHINNIVVRRIFQQIRGYDAIIGGDGADALFGTKTNRTIVNIQKKIALAARIPDSLKPVISMLVGRLRPRKRDSLNRILANDLESLLCSLFTIDYGEQEVSVASRLGVAPFVDIPFGAYKSSDIVGKSLEANLSLFLRCMLERNTRLSNDSGIPVYYPFLSEGMLKISRRLPYRLRFDEAGNAKPTLREICRRLIDASVIEWPKIGFETPEKAWLTNELSPYLEKAFSKEGGVSQVLGFELENNDIAAVQSSTRLPWWLMTLDASLLKMQAKCLRPTVLGVNH
ncbi:asparagine synthase-related protein [Marinobacter sp.]|uniref:asparagine synthase-related protein n=1 Tax=Marinobacter sp. TaxID=50741 RepID=UPI003A9416CA